MAFFSGSAKKYRFILVATGFSLIASAGISVADAASRQNGLSLKKQSNSLLELQGGNWWDKGKSRPVIHMVVDKTLQQVKVYADGVLVSQSKVSTGKEGHTTPGGIFSILTKNRTHHSNIYSQSPMPFMQRLTWSGIALHESKSVPDYPASHGCVRLPGGFASQLFKFTRKGAQVIITNRDVQPKLFSSPHLFSIGNGGVLEARNLRPSKEVVTLSDQLSTGSIGAPLRVLMTRRTGREKLLEIQAILNELHYGSGAPDGWMGPETGKAILKFQKDYHHRVTGSLTPDLLGQLYGATGRGKPKTGHIYVRRGQKPLFDEAVVLNDEQVPLGTHQFTAIAPDNSNSSATRRPNWLAMTIEQTGWAGYSAQTLDSPSTADQALARFTLPDNLKQKIAALITPGSTVIVNDQGISIETTPKGTDFIVLTK